MRFIGLIVTPLWLKGWGRKAADGRRRVLLIAWIDSWGESGCVGGVGSHGGRRFRGLYVDHLEVRVLITVVILVLVFIVGRKSTRTGGPDLTCHVRHWQVPICRLEIGNALFEVAQVVDACLLPYSGSIYGHGKVCLTDKMASLCIS